MGKKIFLRKCGESDWNKLKPREEYVVRSNDRLVIPYGNMQRLSLTAEHERNERLELGPYLYEYSFSNIYEEGNEPLFNNACLETIETQETCGERQRITYNFEFKRLSLKYPMVLKRMFSKQKPYDLIETGGMEHIGNRFSEFLPELPPNLKAELREVTGNLSIENPLELAFIIYNWTRKNFDVEHGTAEKVKELLTERKNNGVFTGDCLEYSRVFSNVMRAYNVPTTLMEGKLGYGVGGHVWSEVCIPVKIGEGYETMFMPVDPINDKFGNIGGDWLYDDWLYFARVPSFERRGLGEGEIVQKDFKMFFS